MRVSDVTTQTSARTLLVLLRGFTLLIDSRRVPLIWSAQRLLVFLALQERALNRSYVAEALWPETPVSRAHANLRSSLWRVHHAATGLVDTSAQQLALTADIAVDLREAKAHACQLLDGTATRDDLLAAHTRWELTADLLPDWYDDWVLIEREQYHQLRLHALEALCERLTSAARYGDAVAAGLAAVRAEPLRETAHQVLIKAHLAAGNRWEALEQYRRCRRILHDEIGLEPSSTMQRLLPTFPPSQGLMPTLSRLSTSHLDW